MKTKVFAIAEKHEDLTGRSPATYSLKKIFDHETDARNAVFEPYVVIPVELDTREVLRALHRRLTVKERYAINCYNEIGLHDYLVKGED